MGCRGKIIEIQIAVTRGFELQLCPTEFVVLHLQLDLMDLQFVHELLHVHDRHGRHVAFGRLEQCIRLRAKCRTLLGFARFLGHHIVLL